MRYNIIFLNISNKSSKTVLKSNSKNNNAVQEERKKVRQMTACADKGHPLTQQSHTKNIVMLKRQQIYNKSIYFYHAKQGVLKEIRKATNRVQICKRPSQYMIKGNTVVKFYLKPCVNHSFMFSNKEK